MLSVREVTASYGDHRVINGISFELQAGELCTVVGASGCGKTTLLMLAAGLKTPDSGEVLLDGGPVRPGDRRIGLILQTYGLFPWFTVRDNVALGLKIAGMKRTERYRAAAAELERVGLSGFGRRYPAALSGGQRQRVAIARTLALEPELLLMDEPFSSIDALTREALQDLLLRLLSSGGPLTTVLVTHSIEEAVYLGTKVLLMTPHSGKIARVFENPDLRGVAYRESESFFTRCAEVRRAMELEERV
jgi:NitT/TauT family transport system ATP-binding protein